MEPYRLNEIEQQVSEDLQWGLSAAEVQEHHGKFVAVYKKRIVGVGTDRMALVQQAAKQEQCHWGDIAVVVVPDQEAWAHSASFHHFHPPRDGTILLP
jgi:hypothetical protein